MKTKETNKGILQFCPFCGNRGRYNHGMICDACDYRFSFIEQMQVQNKELVIRQENIILRKAEGD